MSSAKILGVFVKPNSGAPMSTPNKFTINLEAKRGIVDDANSSVISPRQVLVTSQEISSQFGIKPGELRENITLSNVSVSRFKPGSTLIINDNVRIRLTFYCEPCKRIGHLVNSLSELNMKRGVLGVVLTGGQVKKGDTVRLETNQFPALSDSPYQRFLHYVSNIPKGHVVTYRHVLTGIGVADGYFRAIPGYIKRTDATKVPLHRIVDSQGLLIPNYVTGQAIKLRQEGVTINGHSDLFGNTTEAFVNVDEFSWEDENFYQN